MALSNEVQPTCTFLCNQQSASLGETDQWHSLLTMSKPNSTYATIPTIQEAPGQSPFLTPAMLQQRWTCSEMKLRRWMRSGRLPYHVFGRHIRIAWEDIQRIEAEARVDLSRTSS